MKRHKYKLVKYHKNFNHVLERKLMAARYVKLNTKTLCPALNYSMRYYLSENFYPHSRVNTYCLVTGRTRYTISFLHVSRHIFFDFCRDGFATGFFFSSS